MSYSGEVLCNNANRGSESTAGYGVSMVELIDQIVDNNSYQQFINNALYREIVNLVLLATFGFTEKDGYLCLSISSKTRPNPTEPVKFEKFISDLYSASKTGNIDLINFSKLPSRSGFGGLNPLTEMQYRFGEVASALKVDAKTFISELRDRVNMEIYSRVNEIYLQGLLLRKTLSKSLGSDNDPAARLSIKVDRHFISDNDIEVRFESLDHKLIIGFAHEIVSSIHNNIDLNSLCSMIVKGTRTLNIEGFNVPSYTTVSDNSPGPIFPRINNTKYCEYPDTVFISHIESNQFKSLLFGNAFPDTHIKLACPESSSPAYSGNSVTVFGKKFSTNNLIKYIEGYLSNSTVPHPIKSKKDLLDANPQDIYVLSHLLEAVYFILTKSMAILPIFVTKDLSFISSLSEIGKKGLVFLQKLMSHPTPKDLLSFWFDHAKNIPNFKVNKHMCWKIVLCAIIKSSGMKTFGDWEINSSGSSIKWDIHDCIMDKLPKTMSDDLVKNNILFGSTLNKYQHFCDTALDDIINFDKLRCTLSFNYGIYTAIRRLMATKTVLEYTVTYRPHIVSFNTDYNSSLTSEFIQASIDSSLALETQCDAVLPSFDQTALVDGTYEDKNLFSGFINMGTLSSIAARSFRCNHTVEESIHDDINVENGYSVSFDKQFPFLHICLNSYSLDIESYHFINKRCNDCYRCFLEMSVHNNLNDVFSKLITYSKYINVTSKSAKNRFNF